MEKKAYILLTLLLLTSFLVAPVSFAQSTDDSTEVMTEDATKNMSTEDRKAELDAKMEEIKQERDTRMEENKQKREDLKTEIETKREEAKAEMETRREEFKAKLEALKDEKKVAVVERVDTRLAERNQNITDRLLGHLERISGVIDKMEDRLASAEGGDTSTVDSAIATARLAVASAESAVVAQSGNTYVIELGDEAELRSIVEATVGQFRSDMGVVITAVKSARDATQKAAQVLGEFRKANPPKDAMMEEETNK